MYKELDTRKLSELKAEVNKANDGAQEAEREGHLSVGRVLGCPDCWHLVDRFDAMHPEEDDAE